jgi:hypothetical protein
MHFGWYDAGSADARPNLESGAMNPYPLLLGLEEYGGSITGGMDASYCEAAQEEPAPHSSGMAPHLDTGDRNDARPSSIVEQNRDGQNTSKPERKKRTEEKSEKTTEKSKETGATGDEKKASPACSSEKDDEGGDERSESFTSGSVTPAPDGDRRSDLSTDTFTASDPSQAEIQALLTDPSPPDPVARRSHVSALMDVLRKAEKNEGDGWDTDAPDKKKQTDKEKQKTLKKPPETPERKEPRKARSVCKATNQNPRPVAKDAPAPKKDRKKSLNAMSTETWHTLPNLLASKKGQEESPDAT